MKRIVFIVLAAVVLPAIAAEAVLRIHNPLQSRLRGDRIVLVRNKTFSIRNTTVPRLPPAITFHVNSMGFRGSDPPAAFDTYLTIMAVGGSTTQSFFLSDGLTWPDRLAARLETSFRNVWMNNAGLDGHSTFGHLVLVRDIIAPLHPKVVLFLIGLNDVNRTDLSGYEREAIRGGLSFESRDAFLKSLAAHSELASTALNLARSYQAYQRGLTNRPTDLSARGQIDVDEEALARYVSSLRNEALTSYEQRVNALIDLTRASGIEPVLITQPLLVGEGRDDVTGVDLARLRANGPTENGAMYWRALEIYNATTRSVGSKRGVLVIELAQALPKSSLYFYDFTHYTQAGSEKVAEIVDAALAPWLKRRFPLFVKK